MTEAKANTVNSIIKQALYEASEVQYCGTCKYSYIRPSGVDGYCKWQSESLVIFNHLKHVDVFDHCEHWTSKKK